MVREPVPRGRLPAAIRPPSTAAHRLRTASGLTLLVPCPRLFAQRGGALLTPLILVGGSAEWKASRILRGLISPLAPDRVESLGGAAPIDGRGHACGNEKL